MAASGNLDLLYKHLRDSVGGRLNETISILSDLETFSLPEFVTTWREGAEALEAKYSFPTAQAVKIASAPAEVLMQAEELQLSTTTVVELNVGGEDRDPLWRPIENLSTGQKTTAILLLLLLESNAPLVIDQPEDDLDNRFITDGIVPRMREEKQRRQFIFASHNANIPVLGDAELIVGISPNGEADQGRASFLQEHMGSIDKPSVRELVEEVLEGGKTAFEERRLRYGF